MATIQERDHLLRCMRRHSNLGLIAFAASVLLGIADAALADTTAPSGDTAWCYIPIEGGWQIRITSDPAAPRLKLGEAIGVAATNPRTHRRPLSPPADRRLVWTEAELASRQGVPFRPLVIATHEPQFIIDLHNAGGLSGQLMLGLSAEGGPGKWLQQFRDVTVRYAYGRMEYALRDPDFGEATVRLAALPLAESVGLLLNVQVEGLAKPGELVWAFGGASGFAANGPNAKEFTLTPEHCADNVVRLADGRFTLTRSVAKVMCGGSSWPDDLGLGDPEKGLDSPAALGAATQWCPARGSMEEVRRVVVQRVKLGAEPAQGWIVIGRGGPIEAALADPGKAEAAAANRCRSIAERVVVASPDPYLNQAVPMMGLATEEIWGDASILHGGWAWRMAYLGWRGWYGPMCYGWPERIKHAIQQHCALSLHRNDADDGALGSCLEDSGVYYNMNEVFTDQVRQYFDYTNDVDLMRKVFPVLQGIVAWEGRRLQPESGVPLYESSLDTWISDSHWYTRGQCTTASAYMLNAYRLLAQLADALGEDPSPYRKKADEIRAAMQERLWQPRRGVFAEYLDTLGARQLHPEPELATIYHSAEFGAADPLQVSQMLHWVDNNLRHESTPGGGAACWSSNWHPNIGRSYTHSTYELSYGEQLNLALTYYQAGRADDGYALIRSSLCGIYNGPTPGGLSCHMYVDGRQRDNDDFADAISMWGRAVVEGLYGIRPRQMRNTVELSPQFPNAWSEASIKTQQFGYRWKRTPGRVSIEWESPTAVGVELRLPLRAGKLERVEIDDQPAPYDIEPGVGLSWLCLKTPLKSAGKISVAFEPLEIAAAQQVAWKEGDQASLRLADYSASGFFDPQGIVNDAKTENGIVAGVVAGEPGVRLLFLKAGTESCPFWMPLAVRVEPKQPIDRNVWSPPIVKSGDLGAWQLIDLSNAYSASVSEVFQRVAKASPPPPPPAMWVNHRYWKDHITTRVTPNSPNDTAWRQKIGPDQVGWTTDGIPFKSSKEGKNVAVVTLAGGFPAKIDVPVGVGGRELYLMIGGVTFPSQSHVVNLRLSLEYADGVKQSRDFVNPFDIGDCWGTWLGRFHDTPANGFENLGGRFGPPGSAVVGDLTKPVAVDTEAHLVKIPLRQGCNLQSFTLEAVANDVIFGLMGASILK